VVSYQFVLTLFQRSPPSVRTRIGDFITGNLLAGNLMAPNVARAPRANSSQWIVEIAELRRG